MWNETITFNDRAQAAIVAGIMKNGGAEVQGQEAGEGLFSLHVRWPVTFETNTASAVYKSLTHYQEGWGVVHRQREDN